MTQKVTAPQENLTCPYCGTPVSFRRNHIVGRCDHLIIVDHHRDGRATARFRAPDEFFVFDTTKPPTQSGTIGVYVKRDDPRYATAYDAGYTEPGWPPPIR